MARHYIIRKGDHIINAETPAGAFEAFDSLGRFDVIIEEHRLEDGKEYIFRYTKMTKKTDKDGSIKYFFRGLVDTAKV